MKALSLYLFAVLLATGTCYGQFSSEPSASSEATLANNHPEISSAFVLTSAPQAPIKNVDITGIRAYADGNMHLFFRTDLSEVCGAVIRVSNSDPGQETIKTLALAALMSGRDVWVEVTAEKDGNFCNLVYLRLNAP